jgi:hypothetical protein
MFLEIAWVDKVSESKVVVCGRGILEMNNMLGSTRVSFVSSPTTLIGMERAKVSTLAFLSGVSTTCGGFSSFFVATGEAVLSFFTGASLGVSV